MKYGLMVFLALALAGCFGPSVVATSKGPQGSMALLSSKCTLGEKGKHLELYDHQKQIVDIGCWILDESGVWVISEKRGSAILPPEAFEWAK